MSVDTDGVMSCTRPKSAWPLCTRSTMGWLARISTVTVMPW
ncbi:Uncharacterised protein [Bordetella pertussis]|nr:Uncharacterised protein [Bordetella pertussis]